jgi:Asp-tRNA(Asn)/Glu-tRNA(Gln) amidotransferase A subunit family amidase
MKQYDKALRIRRVICAEFNKLFAEYDGVLMPAVSKMEYSADENKHFVFEENFYTAPASITGLPAVTVGNAQFIGKAFSEKSLLDLARLVEVK